RGAPLGETGGGGAGGSFASPGCGGGTVTTSGVRVTLVSSSIGRPVYGRSPSDPWRRRSRPAARTSVVRRRTAMQQARRPWRDIDWTMGADLSGTVIGSGPGDRRGPYGPRSPRPSLIQAPVTRSRPPLTGPPFVRRTVLRRPGRKERHAFGEQRRPVDVPRLPQDEAHGQSPGHRDPH